MRAIADPHGYIMVSFANDHMADFVMNWVQHLEALGISAYVVGAMDRELLVRLLHVGIHAFAMQSGMTTNDLGWGTENFHLMVRPGLLPVSGSIARVTRVSVPRLRVWTLPDIVSGSVRTTLCRPGRQDAPRTARRPCCAMHKSAQGHQTPRTDGLQASGLCTEVSSCPTLCD